MFCPRCGRANNDYATYCSQCSHALSAQSTAAPQPAAAPQQYTDRDYYCAFIGPHNQDYYLQRFERFDRNRGAGMSWHWPAFFVTFFWFCYRKLWGHAIVYLLIGIAALPIIGIIGALAGRSSGVMVMSILCVIYLLGMTLLPPLYANAFYYRACRKRMQSLRHSPQRDERKKLERLYDQAGCSMVGPIVGVGAMLVCAVPLAGILAAIAIPAYQDYTHRARAAAAIESGRQATQAVGGYYARQGHLPESLEAAGFRTTITMAAQTPRIDYNTQNGTIAVQLANPGMAENRDQPAAIMLVPQLTGNALQWQCAHKNVIKKYLPQNCRQEWQENSSAREGATG